MYYHIYVHVMKEKLLYFMFIILSLTLVSCEEEDAPLQLDIVQISNKEDIEVMYFCRDRNILRGVKEYYVNTHFTAGELQLKCNNCNQLEIETKLRRSENEVTADEAGIFVTLENRNTVKIVFSDLPASEVISYYGTVKVFGKINGKSQITTINIERLNRDYLSDILQ